MSSSWLYDVGCEFCNVKINWKTAFELDDAELREELTIRGWDVPLPGSSRRGPSCPRCLVTQLRIDLAIAKSALEDAGIVVDLRYKTDQLGETESPNRVYDFEE
jgi:hypothetical protein